MSDRASSLVSSARRWRQTTQKRRCLLHRQRQLASRGTANLQFNHLLVSNQLTRSGVIYRSAHSAFFWITGTELSIWSRDINSRRLTIFHSVKQEILLLCVSHISLYEKTICFRVNLLHHGLEGVECSCFGNLYVHRELFDNVF
jgi:hypothetical protein